MNIQYSSDNIQLSQSMKSLAEQKLKKLQRRWSDIRQDSISVRLVMNSAPEETFLVKIDAMVNGVRYYTEEPGYSLENALIEAVDEIDRQYRKAKDKSAPDWTTQRENKAVTEQDLIDSV